MTPRGLPSSSFGSGGAAPAARTRSGRPTSSTTSAGPARPHHHPAPARPVDQAARATPAAHHHHLGTDRPDDAGPNLPAQPLPLLLAYVCRPLLRTEGEFVRAKDRLTEFAEREGFALGELFVEEETTAPAAFEALIEAASHDEVGAVVVPSMLHLTALCAPTAMRNRFEHLTGARLLVVGN